MNTTKKWGKMFLAGMAAMVLAFGLVLAGCDDGSGSGGGGGGGVGDGGTYLNGANTERLVLSGSNFTMSEKSGGNWVDTVKGTFVASGTTITFTITHMDSGGGLQPVSPMTQPGTISGNTITVEGTAYTKQ